MLGIKITINKAESMKDISVKLTEMLKEMQIQVDAKPLKLSFDEKQLNDVLNALKGVEKYAENIGRIDLADGIKDAVKVAKDLGKELDNVASKKIVRDKDGNITSSATTYQVSPAEAVTMKYGANDELKGSEQNYQYAKATMLAYMKLGDLQKELYANEIKLVNADEKASAEIKERVVLTEELIADQRRFISDNGLTSQEHENELLSQEVRYMQDVQVAEGKLADIKEARYQREFDQLVKQDEKAQEIANKELAKYEEIEAKKLALANQEYANKMQKEMEYEQWWQASLDRQSIEQDRKKQENATKLVSQYETESGKNAENALNRLYSLKEKLIKADTNEKEILEQIIVKEQQRYYLGLAKTSEENRVKLLEKANKLEEDLLISKKRQEDIDNRAFNKDNTMKTSFKFGELAEWLVLRKGIQEAMNALRQGVTFAMDMNKAMTEVSIVTGQNQKQVASLAKEYNNLAKQMGVTTTEIAKASVEYYRQGLNVDQVNERMAQTIQYAKVSGMELDESATILTATVNSMGVDVKRASDVFSYLGDATATGADEIGRALQKVGGSANALNVEFEKVASWISVVSAKTRESAGIIGNSMKGLMARFAQIRETGFNSEDAVDTNQVTKALHQAGIEAMDAQGQFRNFGTIMDELGAKWQSLDSRTQAYVATTLAGTQQQARFLNLMENYGESVKLYEGALDSAGTTQQKYNLYMEGTEAHLNQLKATAEGVWLKIFNGDDMKMAIDAFTGLVSILGKLINTFGLVPSAVGTFVFALSMLNKSFNAETVKKYIGAIVNLPTAYREAKAEGVGLGSALKALGISFDVAKIKAIAFQTVVSLGLSLAITGVLTALSKLYDNFINTEKIIDNQKEKINGLADEYNSLTSEIDQLRKVNNPTAEQQQYLTLLERELELKQDIIAQEKRKLIDKEVFGKGVLGDGMSGSIQNNINDINGIFGAIKATQDDVQRLQEKGFSAKADIDHIKDLKDQLKQYELTLIENKKTLEDYAKVADGDAKKGIDGLIASINDILPRLQQENDTVQSNTNVKLGNANANEDVANSLDSMKTAQEQADKAFEDSTTKIEFYNKALQDLDKDHILSNNNVKEMFKSYQDLLPYMGSEATLRNKLISLRDEEAMKQRKMFVERMELSKQAMTQEERDAIDTANNKLMTDTSYYNKTVLGNKTLIDNFRTIYGVDLKNYSSLAQAKASIEEKLLTQLTNAWAEYDKAVGAVLQKQEALVDQANGPDSYETDKAKTLLTRLLSYDSSVKTARDSINKIKSLLGGLDADFKSITYNFDPINLGKVDSGSNSGGSSNSNTSYESKLDGMDKYSAYLDDINKQLEKQDDLISSIADKVKLYQQAGDRGSLLQALELETQQYNEQATKLATLKQDAGLLSTQMAVLAQTFKSNWSSMAGADLSSWTRTDFNKMFEQLFPTKTFKTQAEQDAYDQQKKFFSQLVDDWFNYADEINKVSNDILDTQNDMLSLMQERYDTYFKVLDGDMKNLTDSISDVKYNMDMLGESENFDQKEQLAQQLIAKTTTYRDSIQNAINALTSQRDKLEQGSAEWTTINDKINEYKDSLKDANKDLKDANDLLQQIEQAEFDTASALQDKIVDALTKKYNKAKQDELDTIEAQKQKDIDRASAELKQLQDELKSMQDETADKKDQLEKEKAELELWKKDNSAYAQGKVKELEADIKKREKELAIDAKQKEIDDKQSEIDTINKNAEDANKAVEDKYKTLLDEQSLYEEATKMMTEQSQEDILALLLSYDEKYKGMGDTLGSAYKDGFIAQIKQAMDALNSLKDGMADTITPDAPTDIPTPPTTTTDTTTALPPPVPPTDVTPPTTTTTTTTNAGNIAWDGKYYKYGSRGDTVKRIQQNLNALGYGLAEDGIFGTRTRSAVLDFQRKNGLSADGIVGSNTWGRLIKFDTGGYTGEFGDGGKLAVLHEKERVLSQSQTKAFEHLIYDILPKFNLQSMSSIANDILQKAQVFNAPVVQNDIRIVNNTPFDVNDNMDNLNKAIKQELQTSGYRLNLIR